MIQERFGKRPKIPIFRIINDRMIVSLIDKVAFDKRQARLDV